MSASHKGTLMWVVVVLIAVNMSILLRVVTKRPESGHNSRPAGALTFSRDVAPIIFSRCAGCHRPGQSAPFSLLTYEDVRKRAKQIARLTGERVMPPWLAESRDLSFADTRRLSDEEIGFIHQWVEEGAVEGNRDELPSVPEWPGGWQLGQPDLVVEMPEPYSLAAEGPDLYRNFVVPVPLLDGRFVRAVEFRPGNPKVIHHATVQVDSTRSCRELDAQDPEPGFSGIMVAGRAQLPDGHFIGWTPGKVPSKGEAGIAWPLPKGADLIVQLHFRRSGKSETIQSSVGLHFADQPPTKRPYSLVIRNKLIDIPAGAKNYVVEESYTLPVGVEALSIVPHAHYLARDMKAIASRPDGSRVELIHIKEWNFNWQDEYRYRQPVTLPAGTVVQMTYEFDNSSDNARNPNHPPNRVRYGRNSTDEMAELLVQVLSRTPEEREFLRRDVVRNTFLKEIERYKRRLADNPNSAPGHRSLGELYQQAGRLEESVPHFRRAVEIEPDSAEFRFLLGDALAQGGDFDGALRELGECVRLDPDRPEGLNALARVLATHPKASARDPERAIQLAARAADLTQHADPGILDTLLVAYAESGQIDRAEEAARAAIQLAAEAEADELAEAIRRRIEFYRNKRKP